jgi:hypothetical protein
VQKRQQSLGESWLTGADGCWWLAFTFLFIGGRKTLANWEKLGKAGMGRGRGLLIIGEEKSRTRDGMADVRRCKKKDLGEWMQGTLPSKNYAKILSYIIGL